MTPDEYLLTLSREQLKRVWAAAVNIYAEEADPGCLAEGELTVAEVEFAKYCAPYFQEEFPTVDVDFGGKDLHKTALLLRKMARTMSCVRERMREFTAWQQPTSGSC
jgi:hypothetical protein